MLPSGTQLQVTPKVPVTNLLYIMTIAFDLGWPFRHETVQLESFEDILEFFAEMFAELVEHRIVAGLYRSYVDQEDNLSFVRGRISFSEDLRHNLLARHHIYCRYSELTWDIEENQVIRQVARMLSGWGFQKQLRLRLGHLDVALAEIRTTALSASTIARFRYNRLNEDYRHIHQYCRLFLEGSSLSENVGAWDSRAFLMDMNILFETFVTKSLQGAVTGELALSAQKSLALGENGRVTIRPDILISRASRPILVADCKYKQTESETYRNHDWYQVLAYCIATDVNWGLLIYPMDAAPLGDTVKVTNTDVVIEQITINLGLPFPAFKKHCQDFVQSIIARVLPRDPVLAS